MNIIKESYFKTRIKLLNFKRTIIQNRINKIDKKLKFISLLDLSDIVDLPINEKLEPKARKLKVYNRC